MWKMTPFSDWNAFNFDNFSIISLLKCASHFFKETTNENSLNTKHGYLIHTWSDKAFKGTIVNQALSSLNWGSLKITLTVPLIRIHSRGVTKISGLKKKTWIFVFRVTHATPAALYARTAHRDWECDRKMPELRPAKVQYTIYSWLHSGLRYNIQYTAGYTVG